MGLMYKIQQNLPKKFHAILKSYLYKRYFFIKQQDATTGIHDIQSGVPQGSGLGPILYLLYTSNLPTNSTVTTATYADDTAVIAVDTDPVIASKNYKKI